ncbi:MAG: TAXI family TRAP transporter solute-binding subunit [Clostridiales bacterium]|nr:TAXI family TRAP transporter solute-binding subunit [Clostridiales bacterium]
MKIRKCLSLILISAMAISLSACGGSSKNNGSPAGDKADTQSMASGNSGGADGGSSGQAVTLDLVTGSTGTSWYSYGATFAEVLPKGLPSGSMINAAAEGGATSNPIQVSNGTYQLGIGYNLSDKWAFGGESLYTEPYDNLRGIAGYLDTFYYIAVVRTDAGWTDLADVAANHIPINISVLPAGNMGNIVASMIFEYYGMTFDDIIAWGGKVEYADWGTSVENIKDGRTDFICHNITQGHAAVTELASTVDMTFIQFPQDMIDTFVDEKGFSPETLPANCFKGQDTDIRTFGVTSTLFCSTELPDDVAYGIARALCENVEDIRAGHTALQRFTVESACDPGGMGIPLHPGAEQYYKEAGLLE